MNTPQAHRLCALPQPLGHQGRSSHAGPLSLSGRLHPQDNLISTAGPGHGEAVTSAPVRPAPVSRKCRQRQDLRRPAPGRPEAAPLLAFSGNFK